MHSDGISESDNSSTIHCALVNLARGFYDCSSRVNVQLQRFKLLSSSLSLSTLNMAIAYRFGHVKCTLPVYRVHPTLVLVMVLVPVP